MYISLDWLKDYVKIPNSVSPEELGLKLTLHTVEIDDVLNEADKFKDIIVGQINEVEAHPNADKLSVCRVFDGEKELQIVCGAPNCDAGKKVPLATIGTVFIDPKDGSEFKIIRKRETYEDLIAPEKA